MSGTLNHSVAEIVQQWLINESLVGTYNSATWPSTVSDMPDTPDKRVCVTDTLGLNHGRLMISGQTQEHPGIQIRIRADVYSVAYNKGRDLEDAIDIVNNEEVYIDASNYIIYSISKVGNLIPLPANTGIQQPSSMRNAVVLNCTVSLRLNS